MKTKLFLGLLILLIGSCVNMNDRKELSRIKELGVNYPDSALELLETSFNTHLMSDKNLAEWCMINAVLRDSLKEDMDVDTALFRKAVHYYERGKSEDLKAKAGYYYGRVLSYNKNNKGAIIIYIQALEKAEMSKDYNLAGYLSSYTADLYKDIYEAEKAREYYLIATENFNKARNYKSQAFAYRDIGITYFMVEDHKNAMNYVKLADSMSVLIDDLVLRASLKNLFGNIQIELGNYELAELYIKQSLEINKERKLPNYNTLSYCYLLQKNYNMARAYIDSASLYSKSLEDEVTVLTSYYLLEKELGNIDLALNYYEESRNVYDSICELNNSKELLKLDKKYRREHLINQNNQLKIKTQNYYIITISLVLSIFIGLLLGMRFFYKKKHKEIKLKEKLEKKENELRNQQIIVSAKEKEFNMLKRFLLERSMMYGKLKLLSDLPIQGNKEEEFNKSVKKMFSSPFLSKEDWKQLRETIEGLYPSFVKNLQNIGVVKDNDIDFCCLLLFKLPSDKMLTLLNIGKEGLKSKRHRIIKKLNIVNQDIKLEEYLESLGINMS